jgi:NAD(P)-dependent dehydrogenase (short-subunit alcohol dehydrogenase family)
VQAAVEATMTRFGALHILVNNAGGMHPDDDLVECLSEEAWAQTFAVNVYGPFHCCRFVLPRLIASGGGSVITIASMAAVMGTLRPAYGASKAALVALTLAVARQYAGQGIRANAILPGGVNTPMLETVMKYRASAAQPTYRPLKRFAEPEEIASVAAFLLSDDAAHLTGTVFPVDGGATAV